MRQTVTVAGASVDLNPYLPGTPNGINLSTDPPTPGTQSGVTYDTWSLHYEGNGIPEDSTHPADTATDGLDNNYLGGTLTPNGVVDDPFKFDPSGKIIAGAKPTQTRRSRLPCAGSG